MWECPVETSINACISSPHCIYISDFYGMFIRIIKKEE